MSESEYNIYIVSSQSIEEFAQTIDDTLGIKLLPVSEQKGLHNPTFWVYCFYDNTSPMRVLITDDIYEVTDGDMDFPNYNYRLLVGVHGISAYDEVKMLTPSFARHVFDKLKMLDRYRMMLVRDVDTLIEKHDPAHDPGGDSRPIENGSTADSGS